eukprot:3944772-Pyramimonas_sp.AAC.4
MRKIARVATDNRPPLWSLPRETPGCHIGAAALTDCLRWSVTGAQRHADRETLGRQYTSGRGIRCREGEREV